MKSCFILSLVLSFTFTVFNVSGKYLLVEVDAEMETIPRTMIEGKNPAHAHYPYNIKKKTQTNMCYFDLLNVIMHDLLPGGDAEYVLS